MSFCPACGAENLDGVDLCEQCSQPLDELHLSDPAMNIEKALLKDRVGILDPRPPFVVSPDTPMKDALARLVEKSIGCLLVVEGAEIRGIFTERDALLKLNVSAAEMGDRPIREFMTAPVESLQGANKIAFAVHRMDLGGFRHVPIVDENEKLTGMISVRDILRYLTEKISESQSA